MDCTLNWSPESPKLLQGMLKAHHGLVTRAQGLVTSMRRTPPKLSDILRDLATRRASEESPKLPKRQSDSLKTQKDCKDVVVICVSDLEGGVPIIDFAQSALDSAS